MVIKNVIENIIYILVIAGLLMVNTYFVLQTQQEVMKEAINKHTTAVTNEIKKIKGGKGIIDLDLDNKAQTNVNDSIKKRKFWFFKK